MASNLPLDTLTGLARDRTDDAARQLAALTAASGDARRKLETLQQYRQEYAQHLSELLAGGLDAPRLRNYRDFLAALDAGIAQQQRLAEQAQVRLADGRGQWQQERRRLNAFETLADRREQQALVVHARREQRLGDEQAARMAAARAVAAAEGRA